MSEPSKTTPPTHDKTMGVVERLMWGAGFLVVVVAVPFAVRQVRGTGVQLTLVNHAGAKALEQVTVSGGGHPDVVLGTLARDEARKLELDTDAQPVRVHYVIDGRAHDAAPVLPPGTWGGDRLMLEVRGDDVDVHPVTEL